MIEKKQKIPRYRDDPQKLAKYLTRQGFNWQQVNQLLLIDAAED
jgi:SOS response regulatory protein OraA/RecX